MSSVGKQSPPLLKHSNANKGAKEVVLGLGSEQVGFIRKNYKNNVTSMKWSSINWIHECFGNRN